MKILALSLLFVALNANTCNKDGGGSASGSTSLKESKWVFQTMGGEALTMPEGREQPWLQLSGEDQLMGFGGCNKLMGLYTMDDDKLSFSNVGSTKMYCEGIQPIESSVTGMLRKVDGYTIEGSTLKLMGGGSELATLKAQ